MSRLPRRLLSSAAQPVKHLRFHRHRPRSRPNAPVPTARLQESGAQPEPTFIEHLAAAWRQRPHPSSDSGEADDTGCHAAERISFGNPDGTLPPVASLIAQWRFWANRATLRSSMREQPRRMRRPEARELSGVTNCGESDSETQTRPARGPPVRELSAPCSQDRSQR